MNIIIFGGSGFIGKRTVQILKEQGHQVCTPNRRAFDFLHPDETAARRLLEGQDVLINCIGIMSRYAEILETVHHHTPKQLAAWAKASGIKRWVQLSALGADPSQSINFVGSKGRGDDAIAQSGIPIAIARPSVVYGRGGTSCELFIKLTRLPLLPLPEAGRFHLQPVHLADVAEGLAKLAVQADTDHSVINMTGSQTLTLAEYLTTIRQTLHHKPPQRILPFSLHLLEPTLPLANILSNGIISRDSFALLKQGSCADYSDFAALLGREPLAAENFAACL
ncbi:NAD(P)H-binding protein [Neisseria subflava]|jgi:NAD-dependent epimerase/dehydratase|uniref:NAD(P)H-binding protein n=1 Tax=Neisseria subflava TaxID=28449 RepID=A0A9X9N2E6_NEISU|nr:NAD-dependent epimerase/dehydratase family protein [Neisseria subflava]UTG70805.1 NAD(P)H-binding protein [Neisseria subflava]